MAGELQSQLLLLDNPENVVALLRAECLARKVEMLQVSPPTTRRRLIRVDDVTHGSVSPHSAGASARSFQERHRRLKSCYYWHTITQR